MEIIKERKKYIILDEDNNIVFLENSNNRLKEIFIPSVRSHEDDNYLMKEILDVVLNDNIIFVKKCTEKKLVCESQNRKLKKNLLKLIRNYYCVKRNLTETEITKLNEISQKYNCSLKLLSFEQANELIKNAKTLNVHIDGNLVEVLENIDKILVK